MAQSYKKNIKQPRVVNEECRMKNEEYEKGECLLINLQFESVQI